MAKIFYLDIGNLISLIYDIYHDITEAESGHGF